MFTTLFNETKANSHSHKEGDLYKVIEAHGQSFELYFGYYEECDRASGLEPMPIYPDLIRNPRYTRHGLPFVTKMQDACEHYVGQSNGCEECAECVWYRHGEELLGFCACPSNRQENRKKVGS